MSLYGSTSEFQPSMYLDKAMPVLSVAAEMTEGEKLYKSYLLMTHKPSYIPTRFLRCTYIYNIFNVASNQWNTYKQFSFQWFYILYPPSPILCLEIEEQRTLEVISEDQKLFHKVTPYVWK